MKYRTIWVSDVHLGVKYSRVEELLTFLKENECDTLYLVGDIIDGWALKRKWYWDENANLLIQKLLRKARHGTRVVYLSGNHDEFLRFFERPLAFGNIEIQDDVIHTAADGMKYLVIHGDKFDGVLNNMDWISHMGAFLYDGILWLSDKIAAFRRKMGKDYWSLAHVVKTKAKQAVKFMTNFEVALIEEAKRRGCNGVVAGHIHCACHKTIDNIEYYNCGSFLEHCHAVVEHEDGRMEILQID
jgi:UDP-2,3-diacylglucosamine pyrophosphatase LpxH